MAHRLAAAAADSAAADSAAVVSAVAAVNHPRLMERRRVEAADRRPRTERLPAVAEASAAAVSEVEHPPRATERLPRPTAHLPRAMGHHVAAAEGVDIPEGEANPRRATERPVPAAAAAAALEVAVVSEEVATPVVVECLRLTVHPREDIPVVAADTLAVVVDIPAAAVADIPAAAAAVGIPAAVADIPAVAVSEAGES